jgi:glutaconate CoA-transferase subunit A
VRALKQVSLSELAALVADGETIALGGSFLHRGPQALVRALVRRGARELELVKPSPGYDADLLCRAGALRRVRAGIVAIEAGFGLAPSYRRAIEEGLVELEEHACMTLVAGLRAAAYGVPFQPVAGLDGSDLPELNGWRRMESPYGNGAAYVIPAIVPDVAVLHVTAVDPDGNAVVLGSPHWDRVLSRAARRVLLTAERLVGREATRSRPELTLVPGFMVEAFAVVPRGAWPGSAHPDYGIDRDAVEAYLRPGPAPLAAHLAAAPEAPVGTAA